MDSVLRRQADPMPKLTNGNKNGHTSKAESEELAKTGAPGENRTLDLILTKNALCH